MIRIGVDEITPRIEYTFNFIFQKRGIDFSLTTESNEDFFYRKEGGNVSTLLYESEIRSVQLKWIENQLLIDDKLDLPAMIFFHLVRYEEYLSKEKDEHGRFPFSKSFFQEKNELPLCDIWAEDFVRMVSPEWTREDAQVDIIPSFDIDNTYAYKLKTGKRKWLSIGQDLVNGNFERIKERKKVLSNKLQDPYDSFEKIESIAEKFQTNIFWLVGDLAEKDRNISIRNKEHQELIQRMNKSATIGIHPSYASFLNKQKVKDEVNSLFFASAEKIEKSRQHFLRFQLPESFQILNQLEIKEEHSMGFAEHVGFRCGTAHCHLWFDLSKNETTNLEIHPFVYMDGTLNEYMHLSIENSIEKIKELFEQVKRYGGQFRFLWHNETITDYGKWNGWSKVLDETLKLK